MRIISRTTLIFFFVFMLIGFINNGVAREIGALGYISPKDKIVFLLGTPNVAITSINVKPHEYVKKDQVLLKFSNYSQLKMRKALAELELKSQTALGPEQIKMQEATLRELKNNLLRVEKHLANYQTLSKNAQVPTELSRREQSLEEAKHKLVLQKLRLARAKRESKLNISRAKLKLTLAKNALTSGQLVAPRDGIILEIRKQVGETVGGKPSVLLADISSMYVICDVYESDLLQVKPGMTAEVSSNSLPRDLRGVVERIDSIVDTASRLGKVLIKLNETDLASQLIGMEVNVVIK